MLQAQHGSRNQLFQHCLALADAAPADGIEEDLVDQPSDGAETARLVLVDIVQRRA
jgi:hypothetical protein